MDIVNAIIPSGMPNGRHAVHGARLAESAEALVLRSEPTAAKADKRFDKQVGGFIIRNKLENLCGTNSRCELLIQKEAVCV